MSMIAFDAAFFGGDWPKRSRRRYETGTRAQVLRRMAEHAERDQVALIDAYTPRHGKPDKTAVEVINNAKANIRDYRRMSRSGKGGDALARGGKA